MEENKKGLQVFHEYKNKILEALVSADDDLVRAIANSTVNFMDTPVDNPADLIYTQIFPFKWTGMDVLEEKEAYITMSFAVDRIEGGYFNEIVFTIYVIVHKDLMRISHNGANKLRTDFICEKIEELFSKSSDFGIGKLEMIGVGEVFVAKDLPGAFLTFRTVDQARKS